MSKTTFDNPDSEEREYVRIMLAYSKKLQSNVNQILLPELDSIGRQFAFEAKLDAWTDKLDALIAELLTLAGIAAESVFFRLPSKFKGISDYNERQFRKVVKAGTRFTVPPVMPGAPASSVLGVNVFRSEPYLVPLAEGWIKSNVALIKDLPAQGYSEIEAIVRRGTMAGESVKSITEQIKGRYGIMDNRAKLIAQDQTLKLNSALTEYRLKSVGVDSYIWKTVGDTRVRPEHADRSGKIYSWSKPPTGGKHPGQEVRCRCRAQAIWPKDDF